MNINNNITHVKTKSVINKASFVSMLFFLKEKRYENKKKTNDGFVC